MGNQFPKITMVTPSFQQVAYLRQCIESVLSQNYKNLEYTIYDGGSADGSVEIIQEFADQLDGWVSRKDKGQSEAVARGFASATGEILGWLNSDDILLPNALTVVGNHFANHPECQFLSGHGDFVNEDGTTVVYRHRISAFTADELLCYYDNNYLPQPSVFFRKSLYEAVGGLNTSLHFSLDIDLFLRMAKVSQLQIVDQILSQLRLQPSSKTVSANRILIAEVCSTVMRHARRQTQWQRTHHWLGFRRLMARSWIQEIGAPEGTLFEDSKHLFRSLLLNPGGVFTNPMLQAAKRVVKRYFN